jgi:hypothetical protein
MAVRLDEGTGEPAINSRRANDVGEIGVAGRG